MIVLASIRGDIATYVSALFTVYIALIFIYILLNLLFSFGVRIAVLALERRGDELPARRVRAVPADLPPPAPDDRQRSTSRR